MVAPRISAVRMRGIGLIGHPSHSALTSRQGAYDFGSLGAPLVAAIPTVNGYRHRVHRDRTPPGRPVDGDPMNTWRHVRGFELDRHRHRPPRLPNLPPLPLLPHH